MLGKQRWPLPAGVSPCASDIKPPSAVDSFSRNVSAHTWVTPEPPICFGAGTTGFRGDRLSCPSSCFNESPPSGQQGGANTAHTLTPSAVSSDWSVFVVSLTGRPACVGVHVCGQPSARHLLSASRGPPTCAGVSRGG